jgi:RAQPRD family integrative conjugative element protein
MDPVASQATTPAPPGRARYHFDYARLRADLKRVRTGVQDFLVPQRAQPRDPVPLAGDYLRRDRTDDEEPSP